MKIYGEPVCIEACFRLSVKNKEGTKVMKNKCTVNFMRNEFNEYSLNYENRKCKIFSIMAQNNNEV